MFGQYFGVIFHKKCNTVLPLLISFVFFHLLIVMLTSRLRSWGEGRGVKNPRTREGVKKKCITGGVPVLVGVSIPLYAKLGRLKWCPWKAAFRFI